VGTDQRRHDRYQVHLAVTYASAAEFVRDYIDNLSIGGLFIAGTREFELLKEQEVTIDLPGQGIWRVLARPVFILTEEAARRAGKSPGAGMEITVKPAGFDDAMFGYLLRLGRRREVAVMVGDVPGADRIAISGYQVLPLPSLDTIVSAIANAPVPIIAVVVPSSLFVEYGELIRRTAGEIVFPMASAGHLGDVLAKIDSLL
jgi:hypothetical protein